MTPGMPPKIVMYSGDHCGDCRRSKRLLDSLGVAYEVIEVDGNLQALEKVMEINNGIRSIPVIVFEDGTHLTEPSDNALKTKLKELSIIRD
ncbi:MAG: glutaredoxin domain-containing protein [Candidatus Nanopelagicaceae bacterium]|nr:glutaredoxin domain-containing protein [Candidatus Nanopelagicaceae bacterium]